MWFCFRARTDSPCFEKNLRWKGNPLYGNLKSYKSFRTSQCGYNFFNSFRISNFGFRIFFNAPYTFLLLSLFFPQCRFSLHPAAFLACGLRVRALFCKRFHFPGLCTVFAYGISRTATQPQGSSKWAHDVAGLLSTKLWRPFERFPRSNGWRVQSTSREEASDRDIVRQFWKRGA